MISKKGCPLLPARMAISGPVGRGTAGPLQTLLAVPRFCRFKFLRGAGRLNLARTTYDGRSCRHYS